MTFDQFPSIPNRTPRRLWKPLSILLLTLAGLAVMGYHPGFEDDGIYLSAVKAGLNPALYPRDADFFRLQSQATVFPLLVIANPSEGTCSRISRHFALNSVAEIVFTLVIITDFEVLLV